MNQLRLILSILFCCAFIAGCTEDEATIPVEITTANFVATLEEDPEKGQSLGKVAGSANQGEVRFAIKSQEPTDAMIIDESTGELKVSDATAFDFETRTEVIGIVTVSSGEVAKEAKVTITITDVPVVVTTADFTADINENPTVGQSLGKLTGAASEGNVAFKISRQDVSDALTIDAVTGELKVKDASIFDFEVRTKLQATVEVTGGSDMKESNVTITINNITEITIEDFSASIDENPTHGQSIGTVVGITDTGNLTFSITSQQPAGALIIDGSTGELTVDDESLFDYESRSSITALIKAKSGDISKDIDVSLTITNVDPSWQVVGTPGFSNGEAYNIDLVFENDIPYIAYQDYGNPSYGGTTVKKFNGTDWVTIGTEGFSTGDGRTPSIVIYDGSPYVAFTDGGQDSKAVVMKYDESYADWLTVGSSTPSIGSGHYPKLIIDNGSPYVAFMDGVSNKVTLSKFDGATWTAVGNEGFSAGQSWYPDLAFSNGVPYVSFMDKANSDKATVMKFNGTDWVNVGNAGFSIGEAAYMNLIIDDVTPYVVFQNETERSATVMKFDGSEWVKLGTDFSLVVQESASLVINQGILYLAIGKLGGGVIVAKFENNQWVSIAWEEESYANFVDLEFNNGILYASYRDGSNGYKSTVLKLVE